MKITYNVEIPRSDAKDINELYKFAEGVNKTMVIEYDDIKEANSRRSVLGKIIEKENMPFEIEKRGTIVYIKKVD